MPAQPVGRFNTQCRSGASGLLAIEFFSAEAVVQPAVALGGKRADLHGRGVCQGNIEHASGHNTIKAAVAQLRTACKGVTGLACNQLHGAARCVSAEQGALRAAQHFHPLDIGEHNLIGVLA